ncbi:hypothetical protein COBT_001200 [Conglomerata obtusa]
MATNKYKNNRQVSVAFTNCDIEDAFHQKILRMKLKRLLIYNKIETILKRMNHLPISKYCSDVHLNAKMNNFEILLSEFDIYNSINIIGLIYEYKNYCVNTAVQICKHNEFCNCKLFDNIKKILVDCKCKQLIFKLSSYNFEAVLNIIYAHNYDISVADQKKNKFKFYQRLLNLYVTKTFELTNYEKMTLRHRECYIDVRNIYILGANNLYRLHELCLEYYHENYDLKATNNIFLLFDYLFCIDKNKLLNKDTGDIYKDAELYKNYNKTSKIYDLYKCKENYNFLRNTNFVICSAAHDHCAFLQLYPIENLNKESILKGEFAESFFIELKEKQEMLNGFIVNSMRRLAVSISNINYNTSKFDRSFFYKETILPKLQNYSNSKKYVINCYDVECCIYNVLSERKELIKNETFSNFNKKYGKEHEMHDLAFENLYTISKYIFFAQELTSINNLDFFVFYIKDVNNHFEQNELQSLSNAVSLNTYALSKQIENTFMRLCKYNYNVLYKIFKNVSQNLDHFKISSACNFVNSNYIKESVLDIINYDSIISSMNFKTAFSYNFLFILNKLLLKVEKDFFESVYINFNYDAYFASMVSALIEQNLPLSRENFIKIIEDDINGNIKYFSDTHKILANIKKNITLKFKIKKPCTLCTHMYTRVKKANKFILMNIHSNIYEYILDRYQLEYLFFSNSKKEDSEYTVVCQFSNSVNLKDIRTTNNCNFYVHSACQNLGLLYLDSNWPNVDENLKEAIFDNHALTRVIDNEKNKKASKISKLTHINSQEQKTNNKSITCLNNDDIISTPSIAIKKTFANDIFKVEDCVDNLETNNNKKINQNKESNKKILCPSDNHKNDDQMACENKIRTDEIKCDSISASVTSNKGRISMPNSDDKTIINDKHTVIIDYRSNNRKLNVALKEKIVFEKENFAKNTKKLGNAKKDSINRENEICEIDNQHDVKHLHDIRVTEKTPKEATKYSVQNIIVKKDYKQKLHKASKYYNSELDSSFFAFDYVKDTAQACTVYQNPQGVHCKKNEAEYKPTNKKQKEKVKSEIISAQIIKNNIEPDKHERLINPKLRGLSDCNTNISYLNTDLVIDTSKFATTYIYEYRNCNIAKHLIKTLESCNKKFSRDINVIKPTVKLKDYVLSISKNFSDISRTFDNYYIITYDNLKLKMLPLVVLSYIYGLHVYIFLVHDQIARRIISNFIKAHRILYINKKEKLEIEKIFYSELLFIHLYKNFLNNVDNFDINNNDKCLSYLSNLYILAFKLYIDINHFEQFLVDIAQKEEDNSIKAVIKDKLQTSLSHSKNALYDFFKIFKKNYDIIDNGIDKKIYNNYYADITKEIFLYLKKLYPNDLYLICYVYNEFYGRNSV